MRGFMFGWASAVALLSLMTSTVCAQFKVRELNVLETELNGHYESYSYLTSPVDFQWLDANGFITARDFNDFAEQVDTVNMGGDVGNWPGETNKSFLLGDDYAIDVRAEVSIPPGTYTIAFGTDAGGQLTLPGAGFTDAFRIADQLGKGSPDQFWFRDNRNHQWTGASFTVPEGTTLNSLLHASMHERDGPDSFEIAIRPGGAGSIDPQPGRNGWELLADGVLGIGVSPTDNLPELGLNGLPVGPSVAAPAFDVSGPSGLAIGQASPPAVAVIHTVDDGTQTQPGLHQRWISQANPGDLTGTLSALLSNERESVRFRDAATWWDGNSIDLLAIQEYPAGIDGAFGGFCGDPTGACNNDNYIAWLSGEINLSQGDTRFRLGVDGYQYLAIDVHGNGIAGDQVGEVLFDHNQPVGSEATHHDGEMSAVAVASVPSAGWYKIEVIAAHGQGGDSAVLYYDDGNKDNFPLAAPFNDTIGFAPEDYVVPSNRLRSVERGDIESLSLTSNFAEGTVVNLDVSSALLSADLVFLREPAFETEINLSGLTINVNAVDELIPGDQFVLFDADSVSGLDTATFNLPGGAELWDIQGLVEGTTNRITFTGGVTDPDPDPDPELVPGDCNIDGVVDATDLACVSTIDDRDIVLAALNTLPGDLDGNGDVAFPDFLVMSANFGTSVGSYLEADIDLNGNVGFPDFLTLSANFGEVPGGMEPMEPLPGDCNGDGVVNADDLDCVSTIEERDLVLTTLNALPGDLDGDGNVAFPDFLVMSANFGTSVGSYSEADIDLNGNVAFPDFLALSANFGKVPAGTAAAVPEPSSMALIGVGGLLIGLARRRKSTRSGLGLPTSKVIDVLAMKVGYLSSDTMTQLTWWNLRFNIAEVGPQGHARRVRTV